MAASVSWRTISAVQASLDQIGTVTQLAATSLSFEKRLLASTN
jgi:hypothetical protein